MGHTRDYSDTVAAEIDSEVRALIELAHDEAWEILVEYRDILDAIVLELIEKETVSQAELARLCAGVQKRRPMAPFNGFGKRQPSDRPPVLTPSERETTAGSDDSTSSAIPAHVGSMGVGVEPGSAHGPASAPGRGESAQTTVFDGPTVFEDRHGEGIR